MAHRVAVLLAFLVAGLPSSIASGQTGTPSPERRGAIYLAAALIDRLVHHCHLVTIRGNSYRLREHTELWQTLHAPVAEPTPTRRRRPRQEVATI